MGTAKELQLSMLGAIPPFVGMLDLEDFWRTKLPLFKAGAVHNKPIIGSSKVAIPFLVNSLKDLDHRTQIPSTTRCSLEALYNPYSISPSKHLHLF
ncbi:hypothetical protein NC653_017846 [Populus alba x Populus x berolinensis]|uniref:Uncharacterized protein n=1 Tax=Populus alba x Populus x berolinensis TaxID=444605 RepID=A0AAD6QR84_9ROSI|nr:hypothetical protein NC653_017846 [Populus alba x Populus x berolinensis]